MTQLQTPKRKTSSEETSPCPESKPWADPVNVDDLLNSIQELIQRHIVCSDDTAIAATLWIAFTWVIDSAHVAPLALITAPEKRCGKSQLLSVMGRLVAKPLTASNITPAALFRTIEKWQPTLLIDEADTFLRKNDELRGIINAGHTRDSAKIIRTVGDNYEPKVFTVWGAKALSGIGTQADTIMDRSIVLSLRRKQNNEVVERLRHSDNEKFQEIKSKLARFSLDFAVEIYNARPQLPTQLNDRAQDNWETMLAIADLAGGAWQRKSRDAAIRISAPSDQTESINTMLLTDIQIILEKPCYAKIKTTELINELCDDPETPWATYNRGFRITPRQVAERLKGFGITSKNIRIDTVIVKGYEAKDFQEAFQRYLTNSQDAATELQGSFNGASCVAAGQSRSATVALSETQFFEQNKRSSSVADEIEDPPF